MSDRQHCRLAEILPYHPLDRRIGRVVDGRSSLVHDEYLGIPEERSGDAQQLTLTLGEILAALGDHVLQSLGEAGDDIGELYLLEYVPEHIVRGGPERIEIVSDRVGEHDGILGDDGQIETEGLGTDLKCVDTVDEYASAVGFGLGDAKEEIHEGGFARTCSSHHPDLFSAVDGDGNVLEDEGTVAVSHGSVNHLDLTLGGPLGRNRIPVRYDVGSLRVDVLRVVQYPLDGIHVGLHRGDHSHAVLEVSGDLDRV
mmetsp:Transcript_6806/g.20249  ORF Transcript_6806/g.20249 Transcript_6806/m.20249 type:complete len:255 (-) Transcript_6806:4169-4933(-)